MQKSPKSEEIRSWLIKAKQDLESATWLLESPQPLYSAVGFHCDLPEISQQEALEAVEYATQIWYFVLSLLPNEIKILSDMDDNQGD